MNTIVIIGGGYSGTMVAVNLARLSHAPLKVQIINKGCPHGRGVAYSTQRPEHLLNVAARNMSAFPDHPNHLLDWLRTRTEYADLPEAELRETFIPRRVFGDYLLSVALPYTHPVNALSPVRVEFISGEAVDIKQQDNNCSVIMADGKEIGADKVVLALGNQPPAGLPGTEALGDHPAYCANPWQPWYDKLPPKGSNILMLGTGLTTVDAIVTLLECGWEGTIQAVSRNGLIPQSHFKGTDYPDFPPENPEQLGLDELSKLVQHHCKILSSRGSNPAIIVDKLRPFSQSIWQQFSQEEKVRFCSQYAPRWNVIRHRIAQQIHQKVTTAIDCGKLEIIKGSITRVAADGERVKVSLDSGDSLSGDLVINCTGPMTRFSETDMPLIQNLLAGPSVKPDDMDMGVSISEDFAVIDLEGNPSEKVFAIGPLLRGTFWETIAVPELRGQALRIAQTLLEELEPETARDSAWPSYEEEAVMEYMI